jgi:mono/diheme cytochrome c family protein
MRSYRRDPKMAPLFLTSGLAIAFFGLYVVVFQTPKEAQATIPINPVAPTADSVERGRQLYTESCAGCHGPSGKGDGPLARALNPKPADLSQHVDFHPEGQLYLWINKGVPGTAMPAWESQFSSDEVWDLVNYLRASFATTDR